MNFHCHWCLSISVVFFFISVVKNTTIDNLDIRTFVVIRYFLVINRETRQLQLVIVNLTVNNGTIHDYKLRLTDSTVNNRTLCHSSINRK